MGFQRDAIPLAGGQGGQSSPCMVLRHIMEMINIIKILSGLLQHKPAAYAEIRNGRITGILRLYSAPGGSIVMIEADGLPVDKPFLAVHIHNGEACTGEKFADSGTHLNFEFLGHPLHTGDLPPLLNNDGYAWGAFYTDRFTPEQVAGYPVVIHAQGDDLKTQPSGDSGEKIACGIIQLL